MHHLNSPHYCYKITLVVSQIASNIFPRSLRTRFVKQFHIFITAALHYETLCEGSIQKTFHWNVFLPSCALGIIKYFAICGRRPKALPLETASFFKSLGKTFNSH
jgi:hypothetical protein